MRALLSRVHVRLPPATSPIARAGPPTEGTQSDHKVARFRLQQFRGFIDTGFRRIGLYSRVENCLGGFVDLGPDTFDQPRLDESVVSDQEDASGGEFGEKFGQPSNGAGAEDDSVGVGKGRDHWFSGSSIRIWCEWRAISTVLLILLRCTGFPPRLRTIPGQAAGMTIAYVASKYRFSSQSVTAFS